MTDMSTIAAALGSLDALKNIAQAMIGLRDTQALQAKIIEFNGQLIDTQAKVFSVNQERTALVERIRDLEQKLADLEAWETEKQRYELKSIGAGSFARALKPEAQGSEPPHYICANCYENHQKSILQPEPTSAASRALSIPPMLVCPKCKAKFVAR
jgi:hypothetical protein